MMAWSVSSHRGRPKRSVPLAPRLVVRSAHGRVTTPWSASSPNISSSSPRLMRFVLVMRGDEQGPAVSLGDVLHLGEAPRGHAGGAEVAGFAGLDDVVERFRRLLDRGVGVEAVDLTQVM